MRGLCKRALRSCLAAAFALLLAQTSAADSIRVLLVGDSITKGTLSGPDGPSYAEALVDLLGADYEVINAGLGGASSIHWDPDRPCAFLCPGTPEPGVSFFDLLAVPELPAEIVTIMLGTNDALGFFRPAPSTVAVYEEAVTALVGGLLAEGAGNILLMTPPPLPGNRQAQNELLLEYRDVAFALCETLGGVLCGPDVYTLLDPDSDFAGIDVHPNVAGHRRIAEALYDSIAAVPEPASALNLGAGLLGLGLWRRRRAGRHHLG